MKQIYWQCGGEEGVLLFMRWVLLLSELVSQYRCMKLPKTDYIDRTQKNWCKSPILTYCQCSFWTSATYNTSNSSHLFWTLKDPVLVQRISYTIGKKQRTAYYWLIFFINWFQCKMLDIMCSTALRCGSFLEKHWRKALVPPW